MAKATPTTSPLKVLETCLEGVRGAKITSTAERKYVATCGWEGLADAAF
jgi:hypothetical protein